MEKYITKQVVFYSDGSSTTVNYTANPEAAEIEAIVAENNAGNNEPEPVVESPVVASEPAATIDSSTVSSSEVVK